MIRCSVTTPGQKWLCDGSLDFFRSTLGGLKVPNHIIRPWQHRPGEPSGAARGAREFGHPCWSCRAKTCGLGSPFSETNFVDDVKIMRGLKLRNELSRIRCFVNVMANCLSRNGNTPSSLLIVYFILRCKEWQGALNGPQINFLMRRITVK